MKRLFLLFLVLAVLVLVPFAIWGDWFEEAMSVEKTVASLRSAGSWAWAVGVGLLWVDLFLPVLGTVVMSALGLIYGWFLGGWIASVGSIGAGVIAYWLARLAGRRFALWITGEKGLAEGERIFRGETGGWLVAISRWLPVMPEVVACMAGMTRMPFPRFLGALAAGSIPLSFVFAWIGAGGEEHPAWALGLSAGLPPLLWAVFRRLFDRFSAPEIEPESGESKTGGRGDEKEGATRRNF